MVALTHTLSNPHKAVNFFLLFLIYITAFAKLHPKQMTNQSPLYNPKDFKTACKCLHAQ